MYVIVPAIEGVPQVGTNYIYEAVSITETEALAYIKGELEEGWQELTEEEYKQLHEQITGVPYEQQKPILKLSQIDRIESTLDILLLKQEGIL